jgi:hypothetical protein
VQSGLTRNCHIRYKNRESFPVRSLMKPHSSLVMAGKKFVLIGFR